MSTISPKKPSTDSLELMRRACLLCDNSVLEVRTGCVIVDILGKIVGEGWNVTDPSFPDGFMHAEEMALKKASEATQSLKGSTVFVSRFPCSRCSAKLVGEGVSRVFYMSDHFSSGNEALEFLENAGVVVRQLPEDKVWLS